VGKKQKRKVELVAISDVHLGTYGCQAGELVRYLKSIKPETLVLNGDIIDIWQFKKSYFPKDHLRVIKRLVKMMSSGTKVYYLTGNHDEFLRRFSDFAMADFHLCDTLTLTLNNKRAWFFHGDVFDASMNYAKWLAKLGGWGYDLLILLNGTVNKVLTLLGRERMSFSKKIKNSVKTAVAYVGKFEETAAAFAAAKGYDYVVCGHIHQPAMRQVFTDKGTILYLNSGDWVENLTALEYNEGAWSIHEHIPEWQYRVDLEDDAEEEDDSDHGVALPSQEIMLEKVTRILNA